MRQSIPVNQIICGRNEEILAGFPDACIDLSVTSPPYDNLRSYKGFAWDFEETARQLYRVTKTGGVVVWVVADATIDGSETGTSFRQALRFMEIGFKLHDTMIWHDDTSPPQDQHPRYRPSFEYMFVLCKGYPPNTFNPLVRRNKHAGQSITTYGQRKDNDVLRHPGGKNVVIKEYSPRDNVWIAVNRGGNRHPAPFPEKLAEDHILSWSNPGDLILDPFCGSGTTCKMAIKHHREFIGIDISEEYCALARRRIAAVQPVMFDVGVL